MRPAAVAHGKHWATPPSDLCSRSPSPLTLCVTRAAPDFRHFICAEDGGPFEPTRERPDIISDMTDRFANGEVSSRGKNYCSDDLIARTCSHPRGRGQDTAFTNGP